MADLKHHKQTVTAFFNLTFNAKQPAEAIAKYVGVQYIQHNPQAQDGPEGVIQFVTSFLAQVPQLRVDIKRVSAEGNLVATHSHFTISPEDRGRAVMDIFRVQDGKIVEHWDVLQPAPETAANDNTI